MNNTIKYILVFAAALTLAGCLGDPYDGGYTKSGGKEGVEISLELYAPGIGTVTRTLTDDDENSISTIDILGFREEGGVEKYFYHTHGFDLSQSGTVLKFKVYLRESTSPADLQRIVVLANLRDEIDAVKSSFTSAMTKELLLALVKFDSSSEWNVGSPFRPLPMWGESAGTQAVAAGTTGAGIGTITMTRSVARIDVGLNMTGTDYAPLGLGDTFKLTTIKAYRTRSSGYAAPAPDNIDSSGDVLYPSDEAIAANGTPLSYTVGSPYWGLAGTIYAPEATNRTRADEFSGWEDGPDPMYLVVGGYYPANAPTMSWYRIDMRDTAGDMIDLLRNCRYLVNIVSIEGMGYPSEAQAAGSKSVNIKTEITYLAGTDVKYAVFDDYYMLGVSDRSLTVGRRGGAHTASFTTDYPNDWSVRISDNPDYTVAGNTPSWISLNSAATGSGVGARTLAFTTLDYSDYATRTAYIHVTAGRLHNYIMVTQNTRDVITLELDPNNGEILFMSGLGFDPVGTSTINLAWTPAHLNLVVSTSAISGYDPVAVSGLSGTVLSGGSGSLTISPGAMSAADIAGNPSKIQALRVDFTVTSEFNTTMMRTVVLRQRHIGVSATPTKAYRMLGGLDYLAVYSNVPWTAALEAGGTAIHELTSSSGIGTGGGESIEFRMLTGNSVNLSGVSYIIISSPTGAFAPIRVAITGYWGIPFTNGTQNLLAYPSPSPDPQRSFSNASSYCSGLGSGWRVPSTTELQAMYYQIANTQAERSALNFREGTYVSSTYKLLNYYYVNMTNSSLGNSTLPSSQHYIRCVRNQ